MLSKFNELTAVYGSQSGATKAQTGKKINELTVRMIVSGLRLGKTAESATDGTADFRHFEPPTKNYGKKWVYTEDELVAEMDARKAIMDDADMPDIVRHTAEREYKNMRDQAEKRGLVPVAPVPPADAVDSIEAQLEASLKA
jgi:hypothetical protein